MEISSIVYFARHTRLTVRFRHHLYSAQVPNLADNLLSMLPSLREHLCYNRNGLRFTDEVVDTELGHVFEHVMLAILHQRGLHVRGQTTWNWQRDPLGTFHVTIGTGKKLLVKESVVIAQAIFTNAMHGPVLRVKLPPIDETLPQLALFVESAPSSRQPSRMMFGSQPASTESTQPRLLAGAGDEDGT